MSAQLSPFAARCDTTPWDQQMLEQTRANNNLQIFMQVPFPAVIVSGVFNS
jgi:hypothetical protein